MRCDESGNEAPIHERRKLIWLWTCFFFFGGIKKHALPMIFFVFFWTVICRVIKAFQWQGPSCINTFFLFCQNLTDGTIKDYKNAKWTLTFEIMRRYVRAWIIHLQGYLIVRGRLLFFLWKRLNMSLEFFFLDYLDLTCFFFCLDAFFYRFNGLLIEK